MLNHVPFLWVYRDIDKVDDLMQDITEQQELAQEISDAISRPVGFGEDFDEVGVCRTSQQQCADCCK